MLAVQFRGNIPWKLSRSAPEHVGEEDRLYALLFAVPHPAKTGATLKAKQHVRLRRAYA